MAEQEDTHEVASPPSAAPPTSFTASGGSASASVKDDPLLVLKSPSSKDSKGINSKPGHRRLSSDQQSTGSGARSQSIFSSSSMSNMNSHRSRRPSYSHDDATAARVAAQKMEWKDKQKVQLFFRAERLDDTDTLSKSDPYVVLARKLGKDEDAHLVSSEQPKYKTAGPIETSRGTFIKIDRTETVKDNLAPTWKHGIAVDYDPNSTEQLLLANIYDDDYGNTDEQNDQLMECTFSLKDVLKSRGALKVVGKTFHHGSKTKNTSSKTKGEEEGNNLVLDGSVVGNVAAEMLSKSQMERKSVLWVTASSRCPISFEKLRVHDEIIAEQETAHTASEREPFPVQEIIFVALMARIIEALRFSLNPARLEMEVTLDVLREELHRAETGGMGSAESTVSVESKMSPQQMEKRLKSIDATLDTVWGRYDKAKQDAEEDSEIHKTKTFGEFFDYQFPLFPESTDEDRAALKILGSQRTAISKKDVCNTLGVEADEQVIEYIFASGAEVLSSEVYREIVGSLSVSPRSLSFAPVFFKNMLASGKRMATLLPDLITLILLLVFVSLIASIDSHIAHRAVSEFVADDWANGCPHGETSPLGCQILQRNYLTMQYGGWDGLRFAREELITKLWPTEGLPATSELFGSTNLIGGLLVRHVLAAENEKDFSQASCDASNVSTSIVDVRIGKQYDCTSIWHFVVPFSLTQEEAIAKATNGVNLTLPVEYQNKGVSTALIFEFVSYQRSQAILLHNRVVLSFPSGGSVIPRMEVNPIDPSTAQHVLPMMIVQLISMCINLALAIFYQVHGIPSFGLDFWRAVGLFALVANSVATLRRSAEFLDANTLKDELGGTFYQTEFIPKNIDALAEDYNTGMSMFGFYTLFFIALLGRFFRDIGGLELVVNVLLRTWVELVSLAFVFFIWAIGFTVAAMSLFGATVYSFSSLTTAGLTLLGYFQGVTNFEEMSANHPVSGPMFFFIYELFVVFFALNLLIAVLTAPLTSIKAETKCDNDLLEAIQVEMIANQPEATVYDLWRWSFYSKFWLPMANMMWDARPIGDGKWLRYNLALGELYPEDPANCTDILKKLKAFESFTKWFGNTQQTLDEWGSDSILLKHVMAKKLIRGKVSMALVLAAIASESRSTSIRDARLLLACTQFSRFFTEIKSVEAMQEFLQPISKNQTSRLASKLQIGMDIAEDFMSKLDESSMAAIASGKMTVIADEDMQQDEIDKTDVTSHNKLNSPYSDKKHSSADATGQNSAAAPPAADDGQRANPLEANPNHGNQNAEEDTMKLMSVSNHPSGIDGQAEVKDDPTGGVIHDTPPVDSAIDLEMDDLPSEAGDEREEEDILQTQEDTDAEDPTDHAESAFSMSARYHFGDVMDVQFNKATVTAVYAIFILVFSVWFFIPFLQGENSTAFLTKTLDEGLRDMWMTTKCYDDNCTDAWSFRQTWLDLATLQEVRDWVDEVMIPQTFFVQDQGQEARDKVSSTSMWWDPRVYRISNISIRQQKARVKACTELPQGPTDDLVLRAAMQSTPCFNGPAQEPDDRFLAHEAGLSTSFYGREPEAYSVKGGDTCVLSANTAHRPQAYHGYFHVYDCSGYVSTATSQQELQEIFSESAGWIDNTTRLITIGARFKMDIAEVDYLLLVELGNDGHFTKTHTLAFVAEGSGIPTLDLSEDRRVVFQILISCHTFLFIVLYFRYLLWLNLWKIDPYDCEKIRPEIPLSLLFIFIATFVISYPAFEGVDRAVAINLCAVIYIEIILTESMVFPTASLMSKQVKILIDTLSNAALHCFYVFPFLIIFYLCFTYSGMIIFGRSAPSFSNVRSAMLTSVLGTFGRWNIDELEEFRPIEATIFTLLFFIAVLIVLANMFLAMVTSAAADAAQTPPSIQIAENIQAYYGRLPMYGGFVNSFLALNVGWATYKKENPFVTRRLPRWLRKRRSRDPAILTPWGRLWFPCECLVPRLRPLRITRLLRKYQFHELNHYAYGALVPFLLSHFLDFKSVELVKHSWDEADNAASASAYVRALTTSLIQSQVQERWAALRFASADVEMTIEAPSFEVPTQEDDDLARLIANSKKKQKSASGSSTGSGFVSKPSDAQQRLSDAKEDSGAMDSGLASSQNSQLNQLRNNQDLSVSDVERTPVQPPATPPVKPSTNGGTSTQQE